MPNRPRALGVSALIERGGALLLELRSDCGRWGIVGGAVDPDESVEQALRREVREETGLEIASFSFFGVFSEPDRIARYPDGNIVRTVALVFRVALEDGAPRVSDESMELRWVRSHEVSALDVVEPARPILERYFAGDAIVIS